MFSYDFGDKPNSHEAGLEHSHISYTKGCYTGQEIVERVRSRGQVNRVRVLVKFYTQGTPAGGSALTAEGKSRARHARRVFSGLANRNRNGLRAPRKQRLAANSPARSSTRHRHYSPLS